MSYHSVNLDRVHDLEKLVEYRKENGCKETEWEDNLLFLYWLHLCYSGYKLDSAMERTLLLNKDLDFPLDESEIINKKSNIVKSSRAYYNNVIKKVSTNKFKGYHYRTDTIIEMIKLTEEETSNIEFKTLVSEEVRRNRVKLYNAERYKRQLKEKGERTKKDKMAEMREEVKKLIEQGWTQKEMADKLDVSVRTIQHRLRELRDESITV